VGITFSPHDPVPANGLAWLPEALSLVKIMPAHFCLPDQAVLSGDASVMDVSAKAKVMVLNSSGSSKLAEGVSGVLITNRKICAVHVDAERNRLGAISHIPPGSRITICGDGFNERTLKISWQDELYVVFREDVDIRTTQSVRKTSLASVLSQKYVK
jgi:hypothetical protein